MLTDSTAPQSPATSVTETPAADAMDRPGFEHRVVSAAGAPPLPSPGVRSAFDLAGLPPLGLMGEQHPEQETPSPFKSWLAKKGEGSAEGRAPAGRRALRSPKSKAVVEFLIGTHKTADEVAQALRLSRKQAADLLSNMTARGVLMASGDGTGRRTYTLAGDASTPSAPQKPTTAPTRPARTADKAKVATQPAQATQAVSEVATLRCGLFNDGALHIEAPDQPPLRLNQAQARELVAYLDKISTALAA